MFRRGTKHDSSLANLQVRKVDPVPAVTMKINIVQTSDKINKIDMIKS